MFINTRISLQIQDTSDLYVTEMKLYKNAINQSEVSYNVIYLTDKIEIFVFLV